MAPLLALALLAPPWVGVYFDGPPGLGWGELVELTPRQAFSQSRAGQPLPPAPLRATATTLRFEVGGRPVRATWGLVDGELWIGVLRRQGEAWVGELELPEWPTPTRFRWQPGAGHLTLDGPAGRVVFRGLRAEALRGGGFIPVHTDDAGFRAGVGGPAGRAMGDQHCHASGGYGTVCMVGVLPAGAFMDHPTLDRVAWHPHGDVMRTPWSVRLGPAGRVPHREAPPEGRYEGHLDEPNHRPTPLLDALQIVAEVPFDPMAFGSPAQRPPAVAWTPDARGVSRVTYGPDCGMGHADVRGGLAWFPLADGTIYLWHRQPTHGSDVAGGFVLRRVGP